MSIKITVLGAGPAYGVPSLGGDWGECDPANPKNRRTAPGILIESATTKIMIDMGPDFREQSIAHGIRKLDAIVFTHGHADHILGNFHLPKMMKYYGEEGLALYALPETQREIARVFWYQHDAGIKVKYSGKGRTHWMDIRPYEPFTIGDIEIMPLLQEHGSIQSLGFRIGNFAYSVDFNDLPEETLAALQGLDHWMVECNSLESNPYPEDKHMYLEKVLGFIERIKPERTYLTHMNDTMDYKTVSANLPPHICMAYDGMQIEF